MGRFVSHLLKDSLGKGCRNGQKRAGRADFKHSPVEPRRFMASTPQGLCLPDILVNGTVMIPFVVKVVTILAEDLGQPVAIQVVALGQVNGHFKQVLLEQHLKDEERSVRL